MNSGRSLFSFILAFLIFSLSCERLDLKKQVIVETSTNMTYSLTEAWITGRIVDEGEGIVEYGHCWSGEENPTILDNRTIFTEPGVEEFESTLSGLEPHQWYQVRAYVLDKNSVVTYSNDEAGFVIENIWIELEPFPGETRQQAFGFSIGNKCYFGGGRRWQGVSDVILNDFWEYNTENSIWTRLTDFPSAGAPFQSLFGLNWESET